LAIEARLIPSCKQEKNHVSRKSRRIAPPSTHRQVLVDTKVVESVSAQQQRDQGNVRRVHRLQADAVLVDVEVAI
jgi:hypothetical protein